LLRLVNQHGPAAGVVVVLQVAVVSAEVVWEVVSTAQVSVVVFVAALWLPSPLQAESGAVVAELALAILILPAFAETCLAQLRMDMGGLSLRAEVSAHQPVHSDTTTGATARLLPGHTNSADRETNR
jgi:hypothetical protein